MCMMRTHTQHCARLVLLVGALLGVPAVSAQRPSSAMADSARQSLAPLKWMMGEWSGQATVTNGAQQFAITQHESVVDAASGTVLLIQGRGTIPVANGVGVRTVFESAGLLSFDMASRQFKWVASGGTGYLGISDAQVRSDTLVWFTSDASGARVRYTICHSAAGEWHETGETSNDGLTWLRSFQMTLVRDKALDGGRPSRPY